LDTPQIQIMSSFPILLLVLGIPATSVAQQFYAPEGAWVREYEIFGSVFRVKSTYVADTVLDGFEAQRIESVRVDPWPSGTSDSTTQFFTLQGAAVLSKLGPPQSGWDTTLFLGDPGEGWWPIGSDDTCLPMNFVVIQDTGHVVIDGVPLRTWAVAQLNAYGDPWGLFTITERIGFVSYIPYWQPCSGGIIDWYIPYLLCYSDVDFGPPCDLNTMLPPTSSSGSSARVFPNPGSDQLAISGLPSGTNTMQVRDVLGREVLSATRIGVDAIDATAWAKGTYHLVVTTPDGARQVLRWVKE